MKKYEVIVTVEYRFEMETDKQSMPELISDAEDIWEQFSDFGLAESKYHDTNINIQEI